MYDDYILTCLKLEEEYLILCKPPVKFIRDTVEEIKKWI